MSLRASQVGKPRRQLSTSGPESDVAAGALTLLFTLPTKQCNPQTKPAWRTLFHRPSGSFPASTDPPPGAPEQNRHRLPWSVWIQGPEERFWIPCPDERRQGVPWPSALLALWRPSKHRFRCPQNSKQRKRRKQQNNLNTLTSPKADREGARRQCGMGKLLIAAKVAAIPA